MLRLQCKITITKSSGTEYYFDFCHLIEIKESWDNFTKVAKITLPRKLKDKGKNLFSGTDPLFKRNDTVKIELGYFPKLRTVFEGYISKVSGNIPTIITCEDEMFVLKNTHINYSAKAPKLSTVMTAILPSNITCQPLDVRLGDVRFVNVSVVEILDGLKTTYGFFSYFRDGVLHVGLPSDAQQSQTSEFEFEQTIINENDLDWQQEEEVNVKVKAISMQSDNTKKEVSVGNESGSQRTYYTYNATEADLKKFADLKLGELKFTGFVGELETFGEPYVQHGDIAKLKSNKIPERNGNYLIRDVTRKFGIDVGYRQFLGLDARV